MEWIVKVLTIVVLIAKSGKVDLVYWLIVRTFLGKHVWVGDPFHC